MEARTTKATSKTNAGRWTAKEHLLFLEALRTHGQDWRRIAIDLKTRNNVQVRTHAQKYFKKLERMRRRAALKGAKGAPGTSQKHGAAARKLSKRARLEDDTTSSDDDEDAEYDEEDEDVWTESDTDNSDLITTSPVPCGAALIPSGLSPSNKTSTMAACAHNGLQLKADGSNFGAHSQIRMCAENPAKGILGAQCMPGFRNPVLPLGLPMMQILQPIPFHWAQQQQPLQFHVGLQPQPAFSFPPAMFQFGAAAANQNLGNRTLSTPARQLV
jgi:SHAQKYF class myb-like DNA-binding protein